MSGNFEFVQHPRRTLPPPIPAGRGPLPGTFHPINPKNIAAGNDQVLLSGWGKLIRWILVILAVFSIMVGINLIIDGVFGVGTDTTNRMYQLARNPVIGLLVGILATALIQSSTTTTTLTVAAVGSGIVSVPVAIPIILGANLGTTVTALLVSFSYVSERSEFRRAFTTAAMHLWFNLFLVSIAFIVELLFHPLRTVSGLLADGLLGDNAVAVPTNTVVGTILQPLINVLGMDGLFGMLGSVGVAAALCIISGTILILVAVRVMAAQLRTITAATVSSILDLFATTAQDSRAMARSNLLSFTLGVVFTLLVTASSVTVSTMQPVAVSGTMRRRPILSVILGANVATTFTAMIATFAVVGVNGVFALQAGLVHVILNIGGALTVLFIPQLARGIIRLASDTARVATRSYTRTLITIILSYLALPALALLIYALF